MPRPPTTSLTIVRPHRRQGSPGAEVHEEAVLEGAAHAVDVAEVVDRGPARVDAAEQNLDHPVAQARALRDGERARRGAADGYRARNSASSA